MIGQRVFSLFSRHDSSSDYPRFALNRDKQLFYAEKKKADKKYVKMMRLMKRQPGYAKDRYSHCVCEIIDAFCLIRKDRILGIGPRCNMYPFLTSELKEYTETMENLIANMEKTKNNVFTHYYQKFTGSNY